MPSSRGSFQPRDWTHISCMAGWFFTVWATWEAQHGHAAAAAAKSLQSCPTLCDPIDGSPPGSPVPEILQVRTLEWVAMSFSNAWKWKVKVKSLSRVRLFTTPWTAAYQASPSMGFSRQQYWSGVPLPSLSMGIGVGVAKRSGSDLLSYCISCSEIDYLTLLLSNYFNSVLGGKSKTTQDYLIKIYDPFDLPKE